MDKVNKILKERNTYPEDIILEGDQADGRVI